MKTVPVYAINWTGLMIIGILNGVIRVFLYTPAMPELHAHQLSTLIGLLLFGAYVWILSGVRPMESAKQAAVIGVMWLFMTVLFEFGFGHYVAGHSWEKLINDYDLLKGRLWLLVLIWIALSPRIFYMLRSSRHFPGKVVKE